MYRQGSQNGDIDFFYYIPIRKYKSRKFTIDKSGIIHGTLALFTYILLIGYKLNAAAVNCYNLCHILLSSSFKEYYLLKGL